MKKSSKTGHALCRKKRYNEPASGCRDTERENNMNETYITTELLAQYAQQLYEEEKSSATIEKYIRDVRTFSKYAGSQALTKDLTIAYKRDLPTRGYTILSVNSMISSAVFGSNAAVCSSRIRKSIGVIVDIRSAIACLCPPDKDPT